MTKLELQKIFLIRYNYLSNRAKHILTQFHLNKFEFFLRYFIVEKQTLQFELIHGCGYKTEKELYDLVNTIVTLSKEISSGHDEIYDSKFTEIQQLAFNEEFEKLPVRVKNVLSSFGANDIISFSSKILESNGLINLSKQRNCGAKTINDIFNFKQQISRILPEIIKKEELSEASDSFQELTLGKKLEKPIEINIRSEIFFDQLFDELSSRSRNILSSQKANTLESFLKFASSSNDLNDILRVRNCGEKSWNEIFSFRNRVLEYCNKRGNYNESKGLFKDIEIYLLEGKVFKASESLIFRNYFCFIQNENYKTLENIAKDSKLTNERVRQMSLIILEKIKNSVVKITSKNKDYLDQYFKDNSFTVTQLITDQINRNEGTNFTASFITYVLHCINRSDYNFICTQTKTRYYSGVFVTKSIHFDFLKYQDFFFKHIYTRRKQDLKFKVDDLIKSFSTKDSQQNSKPIEESNEILRTFKLLAESSSYDKTSILFTPEYVIFRRNTKKFLYEFLVEVLNETKRPLHFSELYKKCIKRGIKVASAVTVHSMLQRYPGIFGLKGPGIYGLLEWGGYFGTIGDVTEKLLKERNKPINRGELTEILSRELYISQDSINTVLFNYEPEKRFIKMRNNCIGLKEWADK
jgi:hypothetical protein